MNIIFCLIMGSGADSIFHPGEGQMHPWGRQLISGLYVSIWGLVTLLKGASAVL